MKIKNINFLAKANIKGNRKSIFITAFMVILVISLTLISSYAVTINRAVTDYKNDIRAKNDYFQSDRQLVPLTDQN